MRPFTLVAAFVVLAGCATGSLEATTGPRSAMFTALDDRGELPLAVTVVDASAEVAEVRAATPGELATSASRTGVSS